MQRRRTQLDRDSLLKIVREGEGGSASLREIVLRAEVPRSAQPTLRKSLLELVRSGELVKLPRGRYALPRQDLLSGRLTLHPDGYGFVRPDEGGPDAFVPPRFLGQARHGDRVLVRLDADRGDGRRSGSVVKVLEATGSRLMGILKRTGQSGFVVPLDRSAGPPVPVEGAMPEGAADGAVVVAVLGRGEKRARRGGVGGEATAAATVEKVIGRPGEPGVDEAVVIEKFDLPTEYPEAAVRDAERQAEEALRRLPLETREDYRDWTTVTIDGETARDFDDAVSIRSLAAGKVRLAVHIADVASFVPEGSEVDREAADRGTSVYFPGTVIPMLPSRLSDDLCSLVPGQDRPVQSVIMDFDRRGRRLSARFSDGWIRSNARLTYTEVGRLLAGEKRPALAHLEDELLVMGELARVLRARRMARGSLDFDLPEPEILLDIDGAARGVVAGERNDAHRLIEEFMLAANEAVAATMERARRPVLYRIHEPPDLMKMESLKEAIGGLGYEVPEGPVAPADLAAVVEKARGAPEERFVNTLVLRSLMQARYSELPGEHFGLAADRYTHFTSPIRRYPDLVVHRLLRAHRAGLPVNDAEETRKLGAIARHCSRTEREAEAAEREILERKILGLLETRVGERHQGFITGVAPFGIFVQLADIFAEGLVPVEALPPGTWRHDPRSHRLVGSREGAFRLGDRLEVDVVRVDRIFRRVELAPAGSPGGGIAVLQGRRGEAGSKPRGAVVSLAGAAGARRGGRAAPAVSAKGTGRGRKRRAGRQRIGHKTSGGQTGHRDRAGGGRAGRRRRRR